MDEIIEAKLVELPKSSLKFLMEVAMQFYSNDKTVRKSTKQDLKTFKSQFLVTQAKKVEKLVSMMLRNKKLLIYWVII